MQTFPPNPEAPACPGGKGAAPRHAAGPGGMRPPGATSFASLLCLRHRAWAVDRTVGDELPHGWRDLATHM